MREDAVLERTCAFDPATLSAREARRFVHELLTEAGRPQWAEAAELAVSEVVTNVVLHAHTPFDLTVRLSDDHVRIEVRDRNPALPQQRSYDDQATTGRGMALVDAVTDAHGITPLGAAGKVVWFCVGDRPPPDDLLAQWDDTGWDAVRVAAEERPAEQTADVELREMPPRLWLAARQHHDALLRELALFRAEHADPDVAEADLAAADAARTTLDTALEANLARAQLRAEGPLPLPGELGGPLPVVPLSLDLVVPVPPGTAAAFSTLQDVLDAAERLAVADRLLVRPGLPEVLAVRDWACEQVVAQLAGAAPRPWEGADSARFTELVHDGGLPRASGWDVSLVRDAERGAVAADDANRIIAVSRPLAEALGYAPDELVGRRVVTVVPPRYREAHVAAFSRHLSTGQARLLGVEVELPTLRRDGTELPCRVLIEEHGTPSGRQVFVAWISPLR